MMLRKQSKAVIMLSVLMLTGCATMDMDKQEDIYQKMAEPLDAVIDLRKAAMESPGDVHIRSMLKQHELRAGEYYYHQGKELQGRKNYSKAVESYEKGLTAHPANEKLYQAIIFSKLYQESDQLFREAVKNYQVGKYGDAKAMLLLIREKVEDHEPAKKMLAKMEYDEEQMKTGDAVDSEQQISLDFRATNIKTAFGFLASAFDVNVIFDETVKDQSVTLYAQDVSFKQALNLMLSTSDMFYKKIGGNTLLISPDTKSKREQYEEFIIKTFQLRTMPAKEMAALIKGVLKVNKMVTNDDMNTIMIRDNEAILGLAQKMIDINDRRPAELLLEVEILEVNRNKAEQLGLDYGSVISASFSAVDQAATNISDSLAAGTISLPNITFRYFKQDVDAKTLANPKIRVINRKEAKIHIGDRVPLRAATIQLPTGGTQTSYEYSEIGIRLDVEPVIHFDNTVTVKLNLEVSSLGQNLGSPEEPTYSIGTRNTETHMLLNDGETAMIGGLIRDEDRSNRVKIPGLGSIPIIGQLFSSSDDSTARTDVLLTITPRVVRGWDVPRHSLRSINSGTADRYSNETTFQPVALNSEIYLSTESATTPNNKSQQVAKQTKQESTTSTAGVTNARFAKSIYQVENNEKMTVSINMNGAAGLSQATMPILFNNELLEVVEVEAKSSAVANIEKQYTDEGLILSATFEEGAASEQIPLLFDIVMRAKGTGISYLTLKQGEWTKYDGKQGVIGSHASRIVIK